MTRLQLAALYSCSIDTIQREHYATIGDIMMRLHTCGGSAITQPLFDRSERASPVVHSRNRSAVVWIVGKSRSTPHMHVDTVLDGAVQRTSRKCNRSARSLPEAACPAAATDCTDPRARYLKLLALSPGYGS